MKNKIEIGQDISKNTVKVSALWHFIADYLEMLQNTGAVFDENFMRYFKQLMDYVYGKIKVPEAKDIVSEYVVYEIEP